METVATYGLYANTTNNSDVPEIIFEHSPYNGNWDGVNFFTFVDDFAWFGIAYLKVFDWLKVSRSIIAEIIIKIILITIIKIILIIIITIIIIIIIIIIKIKRII